MFGLYNVFHMNVLTSGLMYLGPDSIMPLASAIAAIIGILLIFWRAILTRIKKFFRIVISKITGKPIVEPEYVDAGDDFQDAGDELSDPVENRDTPGSL